MHEPLLQGQSLSVLCHLSLWGPQALLLKVTSPAILFSFSGGRSASAAWAGGGSRDGGQGWILGRDGGTVWATRMQGRHPTGATTLGQGVLSSLDL